MNWNRPTEPSSETACAKGTGKCKVCCAIALVAAFAVCALLLFRAKETHPAEESDTRQTKGVANLDPSNRVTAAKAPSEKEKWKPRTKPVLTADFTPPALKRKEISCLGTFGDKPFFRRQIFKYSSETMIGGMLTARPGAHFQLDPWNERFDKDFERSLKEDIKFSDDDTDDERALKEAVIRAKSYLAEQMKAGVRPSEIMRDAQNEHERITSYRDLMQEDLKKRIREGNLDEAVRYMKEANEILSEYDAIPLSIPKTTLRTLERRDAERKTSNGAIE